METFVVYITLLLVLIIKVRPADDVGSMASESAELESLFIACLCLLSCC